MTFVDFDISHRMALLRKLYYATVTYFLKVTKYNFYISETVRASAKLCGRHLWIIRRQLPSKGVIAKNVLRDLDLLFEVQMFLNLYL